MSILHSTWIKTNSSSADRFLFIWKKRVTGLNGKVTVEVYQFLRKGRWNSFGDDCLAAPFRKAMKGVVALLFVSNQWYVALAKVEDFSLDQDHFGESIFP